MQPIVDKIQTRIGGATGHKFNKLIAEKARGKVMNIEIANRLQKLRKEKGYSQEDLADALGISRQAVSKWERAEASPDTDNLICLAKLYGVSLDQLLDTDETVEEIKEEQKERAEEAKANNKSDDVETVETSKSDYVHIGKDGIHVCDGDGSEIHIDHDGISAFDGNEERIIPTHSKLKWSVYLEGTLFLLAAVGYILMGALLNCWHSAWVLFLVPEIICSTIRCFEKKKIGEFNIAMFVTYVFFTVCLAHSACGNLWHPMWVVFIFIPIFYSIVDPIDKRIRRSYIVIKKNEDGTYNATKKEE